MGSTHTSKLLSLYERGLITKSETASSLISELIRHDQLTADVLIPLNDLPDAVRRQLDDLLRQIQQADYHWRPFVFGPGGPIRGSAAEDATRLRQICLLWDSARSPEPSIPG